MPKSIRVEIFPITADATEMLVKALDERNVEVLPIDDIRIRSEHLLGTDVKAGETLQDAVERVASLIVGFSTLPLAVRVASELRDDSSNVHRLHYALAEGRRQRRPTPRAGGEARGWDHIVSKEWVRKHKSNRFSTIEDKLAPAPRQRKRTGGQSKRVRKSLTK